MLSGSYSSPEVTSMPETSGFSTTVRDRVSSESFTAVFTDR